MARGARAGARGAREAGAGGGGPSRWSERWPLALAALAGLAVATELTRVQLGRAGAWDPLFGPASSLRVLHSAFSRSLPVPDAALGALGYAVELLLGLAGGSDRSSRRPGLVLAYGAVAAGMALASLGLVVMQAAILRAGCALCLASAALSLGIAAGAWREVRAAWRVVRDRRRAGLSARRGRVTA